MCGRYGLISGEKEIIKRFDVKSFKGDIKENYNIAPTHKMPVIEKHSPNSIHIKFWGYQPNWSPKILINAQAEKLAISRVWKKAFLERRCIVPANYFFEWKKTNESKIPNLIKLKDNSLMGFAGLILEFNNKQGDRIEGFVIITTKPNSLMGNIHNRMPAILRRSDEESWLNPDTIEEENLSKMLLPIDSDEMTSFEVDSLVNSPRNNNADIISPIN